MDIPELCREWWRKEDRLSPPAGAESEADAHAEAADQSRRPP